MTRARKPATWDAPAKVEELTTAEDLPFSNPDVSMNQSTVHEDAGDDVVASSSSPSRRASAKEHVATRWAERRRVASTSYRRNYGMESRRMESKRSGRTFGEDSRSSLSRGEVPPHGSDGCDGGNNDLCRVFRDVQAALGAAFMSHLNPPSPKSSYNSGTQKTAIIGDKGERAGHGRWRDEHRQQCGAPRDSSEQQRRVASDASRSHLTESVARLQSAHAVATEVEVLSLTEEERRLISILPANYDLPLALSTLSSDRKRAFLLLDLASIISAHRIFHLITAGPGVYGAGRHRTHDEMRSLAASRGNVYIQPEFNVTKNRDPELLKLLVRLGVALRCNCGDDVTAAMGAVDKIKRRRSNGSDTFAETEDDSAPLVDDAGRTRKPDGYVRRLIHCVSPNKWEFAVDCPDEVYRISETIRRFNRRSNIDNRFGKHTCRDVGSCRFILRLPPSLAKISLTEQKHDRRGVNASGTNDWEALLCATHAAALAENAVVAGVSVDLTSWKKGQEDVEILNQICKKVRRIRLLLFVLGRKRIRVDLTGLPYPLTRDMAGMLTHTLVATVSRPMISEDLLSMYDAVDGRFQRTPREELELISAEDTSCIVFTADVSHHLVSHAGALCCRIIGAKRTTGGGSIDAVMDGYNTRVATAKGNNSTPMSDECSSQVKQKMSVSTHYYIDDGCYGSLSSRESSDTTGECSTSQCICSAALTASPGFHPMPLYGKASSMVSDPALKCSEDGGTVASALSSGDKDSSLATVWGPTCDGLDRVCQAVLLPRNLDANKDWLVFPQLGCGGFGGGLGLGTAFNGFDPPDTAYCVLGYFSGGSDGFGRKVE